ncbi:MAG: hypothetical protein J6D54_08230 [Olsenella sp.]|nr:hypothetical protein [Olsenella sp.]
MSEGQSASTIRARKAAGRRLAWIDDDKEPVSVTRERPQTWLEELGERNEHGVEPDDLNLVPRHTPEAEEESERREGWI